MATNFPINVDSFKTYASDGTLRVWMANNLQDAVKEIEKKVGINIATDGSSLDHCFNNFAKTGRKIWIYQDTGVPTGWTSLSISDNLIAVKGGSTYNVDGSNKGTWTISGLSHQHGVGSLTMNTYHRHGAEVSVGVFNTYSEVYWYYSDYQGSTVSPIYGSSAANGPSISAWRPKAAVGLLIRKN